ncbi:MAG: hypothetical protein V4492_08225 [Chlamydiota bacterium]
MAAASTAMASSSPTQSLDQDTISTFLATTAIDPSHRKLVETLFTSAFFSSAAGMDSEALHARLKEAQPLVLYLDLDETLFGMQSRDSDPLALADSLTDEPIDELLELGLGNSDGEIEFESAYLDAETQEMSVREYRLKEGSVFRDVVLMCKLSKNEDGEMECTTQNADSVRFLARKRYLKLFLKIDLINAVAMQKLGREIIIVNVLTNATYHAPEIRALFLAAYPNCHTIQKGLFHNSTRAIDPQTELPIKKGIQMERDHVELFSKLGVSKEWTGLLDDSIVNCRDAEKCGFQASHIPSQPRGRAMLQSYTKGGGESYFRKIEQVIANAAKQHQIEVQEPEIGKSSQESFLMKMYDAPFPA